MKSLTRLVLLCALPALGLGGCVAQDKYDAVVDANQASGARLSELNQENESLATGMNAKQQTIDRLEGEIRQLRGVNDQLNGEIAGVRGQADQISRDLGNLRLSALDPETDRALQALAAQYPDLITYDPEKGLLRFMSDLTFDSGSDVVKAQAEQGLARLAGILTGSAAAYDIEVQGHTDNVPPARSAARFPTNRHLSLARAIAVERTLAKNGVGSHRMKTSGWAEHRPLVPNNARGGTKENRRVEIYILPGSGSGAVPSGMSDPGAAPRPAGGVPSRSQEMPMK